MHTGHDEEGAQRTHQHGDDPAGVVVQPVEADGQHLTHEVAQRAGDDHTDDAGSDDGDHGSEEDLDGLGRDLVGPGLDLALHPDDQQDGHDRTAVGHHGDRDEAEQQHRVAGVQRGKAGVQQHTGQRGADVGVAGEVLGSGVCQNEGHEAEQRIAEGVEDGVGLGAVADDMGSHQQRQQSLDHTGTGQRGDDRLEDGG